MKKAFRVLVASGCFVSLLALAASCGDDGGEGSEASGDGDGDGDGDDPLAEARNRCVDKINELRATKGLPPYERWHSAESCVDEQSTTDENTNSPHGTFGDCGENAQNECLGHGVDGIESCLDQMWAEKDQPNCAGCDACADAYNPNCPNCDFFGESGQVCGHYVNMSAEYFSMVACGFSEGSWATQDFK